MTNGKWQKTNRAGGFVICHPNRSKAVLNALYSVAMLRRDYGNSAYGLAKAGTVICRAQVSAVWGYHH